MPKKPSIFVMVDMEGISGICRRSQVMSDEAHYAEGRRLMTADANACVEGCLAGGAGRVVLRDAHSSGFNFLFDALHPQAQWIQGGTEKGRMPDIASFDGLILLGYHAMAGTPQGVLEHTMSSAAWQNFWINGRKSGEIAIDAGLAGDHGVPTIMVSGDDKTCAEARRFIKGVLTAQVKVGLAVEGAQLLSQPAAHALIRDTAAQAVKKCRQIAPYKVSKPVTMRLELVSRGKVPYHRPDVKVLDGRTYEVTAGTVEEALRLL
jgi:D-amino peptidase